MRDTRILLLRHADTAAPDRFHGAESDVGLGPRGGEQAEQAGRALAALRPDALYCSAMRRARQTAEAIGRACGLEPQPIEALHERRMGPLSGQSRVDGADAYDEARRRWEAGDLEFTHEGGESFADIGRRVVPVFREIVGRHPGRTVVIVAHGVVIRVLLTSLLEGIRPADFSTIAIDYVAPHDLIWDGSVLYRAAPRQGQPEAAS